MKSYMATADVERKWYVVDAEGQTLGRLASQVAMVLRGKNKPIFTPHIDTGDNVIVINAEKIKVTGKKLVKCLPRSRRTLSRSRLRACFRRDLSVAAWQTSFMYTQVLSILMQLRSLRY